MARPGRGNIACTPTLQQRVLWLVRRGWTVTDAARVYGMSGNAVYRQAQRDPAFRSALDRALDVRFNRRPVAVHG